MTLVVGIPEDPFVVARFSILKRLSVPKRLSVLKRLCTLKDLCTLEGLCTLKDLCRIELVEVGSTDGRVGTQGRSGLHRRASSWQIVEVVTRQPTMSLSHGSLSERVLSGGHQDDSERR